MMRRTLWLSMATLWITGCEGQATKFVGDAGSDTGTDTRVDTSVDTAEDPAPDVPADVPVDSPVDVPGEDTGPSEHGECTSSADCGGLPCIRVPDEPGGHWLCQTPPRDEATECVSPFPEYDECCDSSECTAGMNGGCFYTDDFSVSCGGPEPLPHNVCLYDECMTDGDCLASDAGLFCMPANLFGWPRNRCAWGTCKVDSDCTAVEGGYCAPLPDYCCPSHIQGFFCIYPGHCATSADCEDYDSCMGDWDTGGTRCEMYACPL